MASKLVKSMCAAVVATGAIAGAARAGSLVSNGSFESFTGGYGTNGTGTGGTASQVNTGTTGTNYTNLTGWTNTGYTFLFNPSTADKTGSYSPEYSNYLSLWGKDNGGLNTITASPDGGNFIGSDPSYQTGAISQSVSGLTVGDVYSLTFYYAGAQQEGFTGATTEGWQVSFGSSTQNTAILNNASEGFTGWSQATMNFTATSASETLSFLATGGPSGGQPPISLLDGVSLTNYTTGGSSVPLPPTLSAGLVMMVGFGAYRMNRRAKALQA